MSKLNLQQSAQQEAAAASHAVSETVVEHWYPSVQRPCHLSAPESASQGAHMKAVELILLQQTAAGHRSDSRLSSASIKQGNQCSSVQVSSFPKEWSTSQAVSTYCMLAIWLACNPLTNVLDSVPHHAMV